MKKYTSKPVTVSAMQWDGTRESLKAIKAALPIMHDDLAYNEGLTVKYWRVGNTPDKLTQVPIGAYFTLKDNGTVNVIPEAVFEASFDLVKSK